jgi:two-component system phosphate regulon sensor histidine kinase PhoR
VAGHLADRGRTESSASQTEELALLREENARLKAAAGNAFQYIRDKVNELLGVLGTKSLRPEELDDQSLVAFDPIGIVATTFQHVLDTQRDTNRQLAEAHNEIQAIFDTVGAALLVLDSRRRLLAWNQKAARLLIGGARDVRGSDCKLAVCNGMLANHQCTFQRVLENGQEAVNTGVKMGGRIFDVIGRPLFGENGEISQVVLAYHDVSTHRHTEAALRRALSEAREAQAKVQGILRSAADGLLLTDGRGRIVLMNHRIEALFGVYQPPVGEPQPFRILGHAGLIDLLQQAPRHRGDALFADLDVTTRDGGPRTFQARVSIIRSPRGGFRGCITSLQDVTEQRRVERMKSEFVSTAAHELRTPLATILGYADLMLTCPAETEAKRDEYLALIQNRAEHLAHIVNNLLDISRIEAGEGLSLIFEPCRLDQLCHEALQGLEHDSGRHPVACDFPPHGPVIEGDRYALIQIVENLLSNAVKYSPDGGTIRLSATVSEEECELVVEDQGIGMSGDQLDHVFDKFYRANTADTAISGTGLGMTIVKVLVEAHHGQICVDSAIGAGTTVRVRLPLVQPADG